MVEDSLRGGHVQACYRLVNDAGTWWPFVKYQRFEGAKKSEVNAPRAQVRETEVGLEGQSNPDWELNLTYADTRRTDTLNFPYGTFAGQLARMQLQFNH